MLDGNNVMVGIVSWGKGKATILMCLYNVGFLFYSVQLTAELR